MKGWECPKCGACYSPMVEECSRCGQPSGFASGFDGKQSFALTPREQIRMNPGPDPWVMAKAEKPTTNPPEKKIREILVRAIDDFKKKEGYAPKKAYVAPEDFKILVNGTLGPFFFLGITTVRPMNSLDCGSVYFPPGQIKKPLHG